MATAKAPNPVMDWLERAAWSFIQGGVAALPVTLSLTADQGHAAVLAVVSGGLTSLVTFVKAFFLDGKTPTSQNPVANVVYRFLWTFVAAFIGTLPATISLTSTALGAIWTAGVTAGIAAVFSLAKNLTGVNVVAQVATTMPPGPRSRP